MRKNTLITVLALMVAAFPVFAATTDFTANGNIVITGVTIYETGATDDLLILSGSTSESFNFNSGVFTVTNPGSAFKVGSSESTVKSVYVLKQGTEVTSEAACATNDIPGTSYVTLPTDSADYIVFPSTATGFATTDCCSSVTHAATYNAFPTCGPATCDSGYYVSGTSCLQIAAGGPELGGNVAIATLGLTTSTPTPTPTPSPSPAASAASKLIRYADSPKVYVIENNQKRWIQTAEDFAELGYQWSEVRIAPTSETYADGAVKAVAAVSTNITKTMKNGYSDAEVKILQQKLKDMGYFPTDVNTTNYFGAITKKALIDFQKAKGLSQSGTTDAATREALNK